MHVVGRGNRCDQEEEWQDVLIYVVKQGQLGNIYPEKEHLHISLP